MIDIDSAAALRDWLGRELAVSDWLEVTQARIDQFGEATDDHQWIHVDPARAARESPFGATVAHGFLTLSLCTALAQRAMRAPGAVMAVNYGFNRVRFIAPVPAGSKVRGRFSPAAIEEKGPAVDVTWNVVIEREGGDKPAAVAEWIVRYYGLKLRN
jgi:acyl dehydratase